jgi:hypothetical protein
VLVFESENMCKECTGATLFYKLCVQMGMDPLFSPR